MLGSGFHSIARKVAVEARIPYTEIPGFHAPTADGHAGELLLGRIAGTPVVVLSGRAHYYEGHSLEVVTFATRVLAAFGVRGLLLTNSAGGINRKFRKGDFMLLTDHINFMGVNPLRGPVPNGLQRFVDMTTAYDLGLRKLLAKAARQARVTLRQGVYLAVSGPNYETPAEIRAFGVLGADAVGMSTVPEAIVARQCGVRVAGLSCISNMAAGLGEERLTSEDVLETARRVSESAVSLISSFVELYGASTQNPNASH